MKKSIIGIAIVTIIFGTAGSCKTSEKVSEEATTEATEVVAKDKSTEATALLDERYVEGTILRSKQEGDCEYTIQTSEGVLYDPTNLADMYKKNGTEVIFKFAGLRMPNRCVKANPIRIEDIRMK
tara:strand:+ start:1458 stop:1832 length:375 start_codon:yes stop_codon:yes gene_type:complete